MPIKEIHQLKLVLSLLSHHVTQIPQPLQRLYSISRLIVYRITYLYAVNIADPVSARQWAASCLQPMIQTVQKIYDMIFCRQILQYNAKTTYTKAQTATNRRRAEQAGMTGAR